MKLFSDSGKDNVVLFDGWERPFLFSESCCPFPDCPCREVTLAFRETREGNTGQEKPLEFFIHLNVDSWQERRTGPRSEAAERLAAEFQRELPEERKMVYRGYFDDHRNLMERLEQFTLPADQVLGGELVPFYEIVGQGKFQPGDRALVRRFRYQDRDYAVEDRYCINPDCRCNDVYLSFFRLEETAPGKALATEIFLARLPFRGKPTVMETYEISRVKAAQIAAAWYETGRRGLDLFKWRYDQVKKIGRRILDTESLRPLPALPDVLLPTLESERSVDFPFNERAGGMPGLHDAPTRKLSPNEPCPCGSGKKYKKCCGRIR